MRSRKRRIHTAFLGNVYQIYHHAEIVISTLIVANILTITFDVLLQLNRLTIQNSKDKSPIFPIQFQVNVIALPVNTNHGCIKLFLLFHVLSLHLRLRRSKHPQFLNNGSKQPFLAVDCVD